MRVAVGALVALTASSAAVDASAQEREARRAPQTDRTVPIARGARLAVSNDSGEVVIKTWDRDQLRVQAAHSPRVSIDIQINASVATVRSRSSGPRASVDYEITAPAWLPVRVSGQFLYIGIEGAQNEVSAETVRGDIVVRGGSGAVTAKSIHGEIVVEDAKGRINASSVNEGIRITGASGDIVAETTNGDITVSRGDAKSVDLATVNGDIRFDGTIASGAQYRLVTHNGDITLALPETTNATFTVRTYNGDFQSSLPTKAIGEVRRGRRATYSLGTGGAEVELESFGGTIRLRGPGSAPPRPRRGPENPPGVDPEVDPGVRPAFGTGSFDSGQRGRAREAAIAESTPVSRAPFATAAMARRLDREARPCLESWRPRRVC